MPKFFVKNNQINDNKVIILGEDVNHIKNVLRYKIDDDIEICDKDKEKTYLCKILEIDNSKIICNILKKQDIQKEANIDITIFQGLPKAEKMELIIQKTTELGVREITPVKMERCVVKLDEKGENKKIERWQKIAEMAAKQSGRDTITKINNVININSICNLLSKYDIVLVAYENETETSSLRKEIENLKKLKKENLKIGIIIGPEGGFEVKEIDTLKKEGVKSISLGKRILRTETAPIVITSILMYELGDM